MRLAATATHQQARYTSESSSASSRSPAPASSYPKISTTKVSTSPGGLSRSRVRKTKRILQLSRSQRGSTAAVVLSGTGPFARPLQQSHDSHFHVLRPP